MTTPDKELRDELLRYLIERNLLVDTGDTDVTELYHDYSSATLTYGEATRIAAAYAAERERLAIKEIVEAFTVKGNHPDYHDSQLRRLETEWPSLYFAIKHAVKLQKGTK